MINDTHSIDQTSHPPGLRDGWDDRPLVHEFRSLAANSTRGYSPLPHLRQFHSKTFWEDGWRWAPAILSLRVGVPAYA